MMNYRLAPRGAEAQRICEVHDVRQIDLTNPDDLLEVFLTPPVEGYLHLLRYMSITDLPDGRDERHGIKIVQTDVAMQPSQPMWFAGSPTVRPICDINLGQRRHEICPVSNLVQGTKGRINSEPLLVVNFELATETMMRLIDGRPVRWPGARRRHQLIQAGAPTPLRAYFPKPAPTIH